MDVEKGQAVPVRLYQTSDRLMVAAPMPGLEPEDISVTIDDNFIVIAGEERGPRQHERDLILSEWTVGAYLRELKLPTSVRADSANATYGNGVLVVSMPKAKEGDLGSSVRFRLRTVAPGRGERVGHQGRDARPAGTAEHVARKHSSVSSKSK